MLQVLQMLQMLLPRCAPAPQSKPRKGCGKEAAQELSAGRGAGKAMAGQEEQVKQRLCQPWPGNCAVHGNTQHRDTLTNPLPPALSQVPVRFLPKDLD